MLNLATRSPSLVWAGKQLKFHPRKRRQAFTLVELLVVIGIIALLVSILLPALSSARESAKSIKCQSNLRTIGQMLMMHANEHRQYMPIHGAIFGSSGPLDSSAHDDPPHIADPSIQKYDYFSDLGGLRPLPMSGALGPYFGAPVRTDNYTNARNDIAVGVLQETFLCPSDNLPVNQSVALWANLIIDKGNVAGGNSSLLGYTSYFTNAEAFGFCLGYPGNRAGIVGHSRAAGFIPAMGSSPTDLMLLSDGILTGGPLNGGTFEFWSHNAPSTLADVFNANSASGASNFDLVRHRGKMNVLYLDGHVESLTILASGGMTYTSAVATPPSGDLAKCFVVSKDFHP